MDTEEKVCFTSETASASQPKTPIQRNSTTPRSKLSTIASPTPSDLSPTTSDATLPIAAETTCKAVSASRISKLWSYVAALIATTSCAGWFATSQLLGIAYPSFQLNASRFSAQIVLCVIVVATSRQSVLVHTVRDVLILAVSSITYAFSILTGYHAALYLPLGNLHGTMCSLTILLNVLVATLKRQTSCVVIIAACIASAGVLCLVQPDFLFHEQNHARGNVSECPCSTMLSSGRLNSSNMQCGISKPKHPNSSKHNSTSYIQAHQFLSDDVTDKWLSFQNDRSELSVDPHFNDRVFTTTATLTSPTATTNNKSKPMTSRTMRSDMIGYGLVSVTSVLFVSCVQINARYLLPRYHHSIITFWNGIVGGLLSLVLMFSFETPYFNTMPMCVLIMIIHCLFASWIMIFCNVAFIHVPPEEFAIIETIGVVLLFVAQATVMKKIHPPNGNTAEAIGAVLVILACFLEPVYTISKRMLRKYDQDQHKTKATEKSPLLGYQAEKEKADVDMTDQMPDFRARQSGL